MNEASIMIRTKYEDDDNNHNDSNNISKLCSTVFLRSPKHFRISDHIFEGGW